jgi:hypothetical protein
VRISSGQRRAIAYMLASNRRLFGVRTRRNVPRSSRFTFHVADAAVAIKTNRFLAKVLAWLGNNFLPGTADRAHFRRRMLFLKDLNEAIRQTLLRKSPRTAPLYIAGADAEAYMSTLDMIHRVFRAFRIKYIESQRDMNAADREVAEAWWQIRSLINVGHLNLTQRPEDKFWR